MAPNLLYAVYISCLTKETENGFMEPIDTMRFGGDLDNLIIIREYDRMPKDGFSMVLSDLLPEENPRFASYLISK